MNYLNHMMKMNTKIDLGKDILFHLYCANIQTITYSDIRNGLHYTLYAKVLEDFDNEFDVLINNTPTQCSMVLYGEITDDEDDTSF